MISLSSCLDTTLGGWPQYISSAGIWGWHQWIDFITVSRSVQQRLLWVNLTRTVGIRGWPLDTSSAIIWGWPKCVEVNLTITVCLRGWPLYVQSTWIRGWPQNIQRCLNYIRKGEGFNFSRKIIDCRCKCIKIPNISCILLLLLIKDQWVEAATCGLQSFQFYSWLTSYWRWIKLILILLCTLINDIVKTWNVKCLDFIKRNESWISLHYGQERVFY